MKLYEFKFQIDDLYGQAEARSMKFLYDVNPDINAGLVDVYALSEDDHYMFMNHLQIIASDVYEKAQRLSDYLVLYRQFLTEEEIELPRYQFDVQDDETGQRIVQYRMLLPNKYDQSSLRNNIMEALINGTLSNYYIGKGFEKGAQTFGLFHTKNLSIIKDVASGSNNDQTSKSRTRRTGLY